MDNKRFRGIPWVLPVTILILCVTFYPLIYCISISFRHTSFLDVGGFIGFENYIRFFRDSTSLHSLTLSLIFVSSSTFLSIVLGFILAWILDKDLPFRSILRALIIAPWVIAQITAAVIGTWMLNANLGPLAYFCQKLGFAKPSFLADPILALLSVIGVSVWRFYPFPMVLIMAALQTIPDGVYEAGRIDGASWWQEIRYITLPMIRSPLLVVTILSTVFYFNKITVPYVLTGGGPGNATNVLTLHLYRETFLNWRMGYGATIATIIFVINLIVSIAYYKVLGKESHA